MHQQNRAILTTKKQVISLPSFLLIISFFITVGGEFANNSLHYTNGSISIYNIAIIPLFALIFYMIGIITQDR